MFQKSLYLSLARLMLIFLHIGSIPAQAQLAETTEMIVAKWGPCIGKPINDPQGFTRRTWKKGDYFIQARFHPFGNCVALTIKKRGQSKFTQDMVTKLITALCPRQQFEKDTRESTKNEAFEFLITWSKSGQFRTVFEIPAKGTPTLTIYDLFPEQATCSPDTQRQWNEWKQKWKNQPVLGEKVEYFIKKWGRPSSQEIYEGEFLTTWNNIQGIKLILASASQHSECYRIVISADHWMRGIDRETWKTWEQKFVPYATFNILTPKDVKGGINLRILHVDQKRYSLDGRFMSQNMNGHDSRGGYASIILEDRSLRRKQHTSSDASISDF